MQIKLLVNITPIRKPLTGIGYYTLNILRELLDKDIDVIGVRNGKVISREQLILLSKTFLEDNSNSDSNDYHFKRHLVELIRKVPGVYQLKNIVLSFRVKRALSLLAKDNYVYFEPSFVPFEYKGKTITTIHDLSFLSFPEFHPKTRVTYLQGKISDAIKKSSHVIVDSDYIFDEICNYFPFCKDKSSTVYLGVDSGFKLYSELECKENNQKLGLNYKKFILSVATLEPRKNLRRLIAAYLMIPEQIRKMYPLVLVGDSGWKNSELFSDAEELIKNNQLILTGYVSDSNLKKLYASAMIFAYPSLYEGFGLPVVEAMASGVPVITSSRGATAEISNDNALLVDPEDEHAISAAILNLIENTEMREVLTASGIAWAQKYNWSNTVTEILEIAEAISNI